MSSNPFLATPTWAAIETPSMEKPKISESGWDHFSNPQPAVTEAQKIELETIIIGSVNGISKPIYSVCLNRGGDVQAGTPGTRWLAGKN